MTCNSRWVTAQPNSRPRNAGLGLGLACEGNLSGACRPCQERRIVVACLSSDDGSCLVVTGAIMTGLLLRIPGGEKQKCAHYCASSNMSSEKPLVIRERTSLSKGEEFPKISISHSWPHYRHRPEQQGGKHGRVCPKQPLSIACYMG